MGFLSNISKNLENSRSRKKLNKIVNSGIKETKKDIKKKYSREKRSALNDPDILTYINGIQFHLAEFKKIRPPIYDSYGTDPCPINKNILFPYNYFVKCDQNTLKQLRRCYLKRFVARLHFHSELIKFAKILQEIVIILGKRYPGVHLQTVGKKLLTKELKEYDKQIKIFNTHYIAQQEIEDWVKMCDEQINDVSPNNWYKNDWVKSTEWDKKRRLSRKAFDDPLITKKVGKFDKLKMLGANHKAPVIELFDIISLIPPQYKQSVKDLIT